MRGQASGPGPGGDGRSGGGSRRGVARGEVLLALSIVALLLAAGYPRAERAFMVRQARAAGDAVEAVREAVYSALRDEGTWPESAPLGTVPKSLQGRLTQDFTFHHARYALQWERWEAPEPEAATAVELPPPDDGPPPGLTRRALAAASMDPDTLENPALPRGTLPGAQAPPDSVPPAPPPIVALGAITVVCEDPRILSALLDRFGSSRSFVRESAWTLVLTREGPP